ncbi:hypothetical protein LXA43DRAFT_1011288 [Ganoderma leucocontextum]|nr:hypothetical protein LXA43DRAFT_1011288 [Ganoderma leucocontextum]
MSHAGASGHGLPSLDDVLTQITTHSPNLASYLRSFAPREVRETILASTLGSGQDPLTVLDPQRNTLGFLYILSARLHSSSTANQAANATLPDAIEAFTSNFDPPHARLAADRVSMLGRDIARYYEAAHNPRGAIGPLSNLVQRYPPDPSFLTTLHPVFLKLCVAHRHFTAALPVLSHPITSINTTLSDLTYNDNLIYHYAGGIALAALKRWQQAEEFFEICVTAPAHVPAAIQLEAYKKLVLVQLIQYGETIPPPKYTLPALQRQIKNTPYQGLTKHYPAQVNVLRQIVAKDQDIFAQEKNLGLVNQAIDRAPVWLIKKLTATYLTLGLGDIGKEVGIDSPEEVRETILSMIESGEINASISEDGTVTFSDPVPRISKDELDEMLVDAQEHSRLLNEIERGVNVSKEYLTKVRVFFPSLPVAVVSFADFAAGHEAQGRRGLGTGRGHVSDEHGWWTRVGGRHHVHVGKHDCEGTVSRASALRRGAPSLPTAIELSQVGLHSCSNICIMLNRTTIAFCTRCDLLTVESPTGACVAKTRNVVCSTI